MSLLYLIRDNWTADEINKLYDNCYELGYIGEECFIRNPEAIINIAGGRYKIITVGDSPKLPLTYKVADGQKIIGCFANGDWTHFVNLDSKLQVTYDSLGYDRLGNPISNCRRKGKLVSLRVFEEVSHVA